MRRPTTVAAVLVTCAAGVAWAIVHGLGDASARAGDDRADSAIVWVFFQPDSTAVEEPTGVGRDTAGRAPSISHGSAGDQPIPLSLIDRVSATGARVREASRWLRAVSVEASPEQIGRIAAIPAVQAIRPVGSLIAAGADDGMPASAADIAGLWPAAMSATSDAVTSTGTTTMALRVQAQDSLYYGPNYRALRQLGVPSAHVATFTGSGIRVAILDTGFDLRHESLAGRSVLRTRDFVNGDNIVYDEVGDPVNQSRHGTRVWSMLGGLRPGTLVGPAYTAQFILAKVKAEPSVSQADEDRWVSAVEWADSLDVDVIVSALYFRSGFIDRPDIQYGELDGNTTVTTRIADEAARRGILVVNAVGDLGPGQGTLAAPADGDSVLSVGAVDAAGLPATFQFAATSRGPTADGRTKPDVVARGTSLIGASSLSTGAYDIGLEGTSYATALVAGSAALVMEAWPQLTASGVRNALILSGNRSRNPDNTLGFGVPDVASAILLPEGLRPASIATVDLSNTVTTLAPTFSWQAPLVNRAFGPVSYRVEVAADSLFSNPVYVDSVSESFALSAKRPIRPAQRLYWRVIARAGLDVGRTSGPSQPFTVPNWVRLVSPNPDQVSFVNSQRPTLSWTPLAAPPPIGPLTYDVEVLSNETGVPVQPAQRNLATASVQVDAPLVPNTAYRWRVIAKTQLGPVDTVETINPFVVTSDQLPPSTLLYQNFPNPFPNASVGHSGTQVWFDLAERSAVELEVLDLGGRLVRRLIPAERSCGRVDLVPGIYGRGAPLEVINPCIMTRWDGTDANGRQVVRGVYILRLRVNGRDLYRRMVFLPTGDQ